MLSLRAISSFATSSLPGVVDLFAQAAINLEFTAGDIQSRFIYAATKEFITYATDTLYDQPFLGTLEKPISFERSIVNANGFGEISVGYGELQLINTDADYDDLIGRYAVDGQRVVLKVGMVDELGFVASYDEFSTLIDLTARSWTIDEDMVTIALRDNSYKLEVPAQPNTYTGEGGTDGSSDLAGKRKPLVLGEVSQITPALLIPGLLVYQVHDGSVHAIDAVYDAGGLLEHHGNYPDTVTMQGVGIATGYVTCTAEGTFMLGAAPFGRVTADVRGANDDGYVETTADIVQYLLLRSTELTIDDIDTNSFLHLNEVRFAPVGYYINQDSNETVAEVVGKLMAGISSWLGFNPVGTAYVRYVAPPTTVIVQSYDEYDLLRLNLERLPTGIDPVIKTARVAYDRNWTPQAGTELIADVVENDPDLVSYLASSFRLASPTTDNSELIASAHPLAIDPPPVEAFFVEEADARAEADNRMALYGVERSIYRFTTKEHLFAQDVGDTIYLQTDRLDLTDGKYLLVVQVNDNLESGETEIVGFG